MIKKAFQKNHLSGIQRAYLKISFSSMVELGKLKRDLMPLIRKNKNRVKNESTYTAALARFYSSLFFLVCKFQSFRESVGLSF